MDLYFSLVLTSPKALVPALAFLRAYLAVSTLSLSLFIIAAQLAMIIFYMHHFLLPDESFTAYEQFAFSTQSLLVGILDRISLNSLLAGTEESHLAPVIDKICENIPAFIKLLLQEGKPTKLSPNSFGVLRLSVLEFLLALNRLDHAKIDEVFQKENFFTVISSSVSLCLFTAF